MDFSYTVKTLKPLLSSQLSKIETKSDHDIQLLDELRDYFKKKLDLDAEYLKNQEKLIKSVSIIKKKLASSAKLDKPTTSKSEKSLATVDGAASKTSIESINPSYSGIANPSQTVMSAFLEILSEHESLIRSQMHQNTLWQIEILFLKEYSKEKVVFTKKCAESLSLIHEEYIKAVLEYEKIRKIYEESEKEHESCVSKYEDASRKGPG
jgi:uncharacterized protein YeeX (DUF496 family)